MRDIKISPACQDGASQRSPVPLATLGSFWNILPLSTWKTSAQDSFRVRSRYEGFSRDGDSSDDSDNWDEENGDVSSSEEEQESSSYCDRKQCIVRSSLLMMLAVALCVLAAFVFCPDMSVEDYEDWMDWDVVNHAVKGFEHLEMLRLAGHAPHERHRSLHVEQLRRNLSDIHDKLTSNLSASLLNTSNNLSLLAALVPPGGTDDLGEEFKQKIGIIHSGRPYHGEETGPSGEAINHGPNGERYAPGDREIMIAKCVISIDQTVLATTVAGLAVEEAARVCDPHGDDFSDPGCGKSVSEFFTNMAWATAYIFYAPAFCGVRDIMTSWCGGDWAWLIGNVGEVVTSSFGLADECPKNETAEDDDDIGDADFRRLSDSRVPQLPDASSSLQIWAETSQRHPDAAQHDHALLRRADSPSKSRRLVDEEKRERINNLVNCAAHANIAADMLAKFGVNGWASARACARMSRRKTHDDRMACGGYITTLISYAPFTANQFAVMSGVCPVDHKSKPLCAAYALDTSAATISFGAWGTTIQADCRENDGPPEPPPDGF